MTRYVALLRGINVGRAKALAMADLRELMAELGHTEVLTHLRSGNAVFSSPGPGPGPAQLASGIEAAIDRRLGMTVKCMVRSGDDLAAVIAGNPLLGGAGGPAGKGDGSKLMALFLGAAPDAELLRIHDPRALAPGEIAIGDRVVYQWCPDGLLAAPPVSAYVERNLGVVVTTRNWNTVTRIAAMMGARAGD